MPEPAISESIVFDALRTAILNSNTEEFHEILKKQIGETIKKALNFKEAKSINRLVVGIHYISYATGNWYRIITEEPASQNNELTPIESDYYEERQNDVASRGLNLYTDDHLMKRLHIVFKMEGSAISDAAFDCAGWRKDLMLFQDLCSNTNLVEFALGSDVEFCKNLKISIDDKRNPNPRNLPFCLKSFRKNAIATYTEDEFESLQRLIDSFANILIDEPNGKFSSWRKEQISALIRQKVTTLRDELLPEYEHHFEAFSSDDWSKLAKRLWSFRLFIFSFYSTLHLKNIPADENLYLLIDPFYWRQKIHEMRDAKDICIRYMAFGMAYSGKSPLSGSDLEHISDCLLHGLRELFQAELYYGLTFGKGNIIVAEDSVRQCTMLSREVLEEVNLYRHYIEKNWLSNSHEDTRRKFIEHFVGRSSKIIEMLERMKAIVAPADSEKEDELPKGKCIFMHSLPGCGKENIAKLIHLVSCRNFYNEKNHSLMNSHYTKDNELIFKLLADYNKTFSAELNTNDFDVKDKEVREKLEAYFDKLKADIKDKTKRIDDPLEIKKGELFNYRVQHCGELNDPDRFSEVLFGYEKDKGTIRRWAGLMPLVHGLGGTLFLDEFNTLPYYLSIKFLRIFESPYEIEMPWDSQRYRMSVNILTIFASNLDSLGLIERKFSPAVIGRITQNTFEIPPLRDRKEDIAVFVNSYLQKLKNKDKEGMIKNVTRINLDALRLICELPWLDNYRGIKGLLDEIILERKYRRIAMPNITFDEVIKAIAKRELLTSKGAEEDLESAFKA